MKQSNFIIIDKRDLEKAKDEISDKVAEFYELLGFISNWFSSQVPVSSVAGVGQQNIKFIFKVYDKKTKKELKPEFGGDILVGEYFTLLRHYKPNNNGGYSFYRDELLDNDNLIIELVA